MNLIKKIHTVIKLLRTKLRKIFIQTKLNKSSVAQNHHYHFNHPNLFDKLCTLYGTDKGFLEFEGTKPYGYRPHTYSTVYHNLFDHCKENINLVYSGRLDMDNVHKNYYYAVVQNKINYMELSKIGIVLELPTPNYNLYKFN